MLRIIWLATILFNPALVISDIGSKINAANIHIKTYLSKRKCMFYYFHLQNCINKLSCGKVTLVQICKLQS